MGIEKALAVGDLGITETHASPGEKPGDMPEINSNMITQTLLTAQQAAEVLTISVRTLNRMVHKGIVRQLRVGPNGPRRFLMQDIERALIPGQSPSQAPDGLGTFIASTIKKKG